MALVQFGGLVDAVSGRLGSLCFGRQGGRAIVRMQPIVKPKDSAAVTTVQNAMHWARFYWQDMGEANRATWNNAARVLKVPRRLGGSGCGSGYELWCRTAIRQLLGGPGLIFEAQTMTGYRWAGVAGVEAWPGGPFEVYASVDLGTERPYVIVRAQRLMTGGRGQPGKMLRVVARSRWSFVAVDAWNPRMSGSTVIAPGITGAFGVPVRGDWIRGEVEQYVPGFGTTLVNSFLVQVPNCGDELVYNGTFEDNSSVTPGWSVLAPGVLTEDVVNPYMGDQDGKWVVPAGGGYVQFVTSAAHYFPMTAGAAYTFRACYRVVSGNILRWGYGKDGVGYQWFSGACPVTDGTWQRWEIPFVATYGGAGFKLGCQTSMAGAVEVHFDNVSLRKDVY
jgi:hypothetical protein